MLRILSVSCIKYQNTRDIIISIIIGVIISSCFNNLSYIGRYILTFIDWFFIRALLIYTNVNIHFDLDTDVMYVQSNFVVVWLMHCSLKPSVFHFNFHSLSGSLTRLPTLYLCRLWGIIPISFISDNKNGLQWK
jgi:hypothetical protein